MTDFHRVTPDFAVAAQLTAADVARAAAEGFRTIMNNRPEGEGADQVPGAEIEAAARAHGLDYRALPFSGPPPPAVVAETALLLDAAPGPVLGYCRSGARSIMAWAMAQALEGKLRPDEIIAMAANAGYDLRGARGAFERLAPKP
jgi:sulfide:quinone oxidoreductase